MAQAISKSTDVQVFLTCADEDIQKNAKEIWLWLKENNLPVITEFNSSKMMALNKNEWFDDALRSDFVLVCIDENYQKTACHFVPTGISDNEKQSEAQYIFNHMHTSIVHNGCINNRFIPILFPGGTIDHIPSILRDSKLYFWPKDKKALFNRLTGRSEFSAPQQGPPVKAVFHPVG